MLFTWIYDYNVQDVMTIGKYIESTRGSELRAWYDEIILKEK